MLPVVSSLLADQSGVVSRRQLTAAEVPVHTLERMLRTRELTRLHDGVYVDHTGPPDFPQLAWAAVLWAWPAALTGESALRACEGASSRRRPTPVHVVVPRGRRLTAPDGVVLHRSDPQYAAVVWTRRPPCVRYEDAAVDVAAHAPSALAAFAELAAALHTRRTTSARLSTALDRRARVPRRRWLVEVLADLAAGTTSVLERGYVVRVERPHGLPRAEQQVREAGPAGVVVRDGVYRMPGGTVVLELDGRAYHDDPAQRDRDLTRDLAVAASLRSTVRLGWSQVYGDSCRTAALMAQLLRGLGWTGTPRACSATCAL
jgi:hypothetical protein